MAQSERVSLATLKALRRVLTRRKETMNTPSVDAMLRGLTERSNVQSTLILSRRDGSIIRATGVGTQYERSSSASGKSCQWPQAREMSRDLEEPERDGAFTTAKTDESTSDQQTAKPAEVLAASIFHFVNNANVLGETLGNTSRDGVREEGTFATFGYGEAMDDSTNGANFGEDMESNPSADEVQLLRLRTKHQEIIIFPDANYICCVVQKVGKAAAVHEKR